MATRSAPRIPRSARNGCVCCVYGNGNSRCRPPKDCTGVVVGPGTPTTTTAAPTTTTTTTTGSPTSTTTTTTTTGSPTSTTTTTAGPGAGPGGACQVTGNCQTGLTCCSSFCRDLSSDPGNCNSCGNSCPGPTPGVCQGAAICTGGTCGFSSIAGTVCTPQTDCREAAICGAPGSCPPGAPRNVGGPCNGSTGTCNASGDCAVPI